MTDVTSLLNAASGPALFLVALVVIVKVLWSDRRAEKLMGVVVDELRRRLADVETQLAWAEGRVAQLEQTITSAGWALPAAERRPVSTVPDHH